MKTNKLWISAFAGLLMASFIGGCVDENVETVGVCPLVLSTDPVNLATNVPLDKAITVTFNESMNPATITPGALSISSPADAGGRKAGVSAISGELTYDASTFTMRFVPGVKLEANTTYTATVGTSVKDLMGNALQTPYIWTFSTGARWGAVAGVGAALRGLRGVGAVRGGVGASAGAVRRHRQRLRRRE